MDLSALRTRAALRFRDPTMSIVVEATWTGHVNYAYQRFLMETGFNMEVGLTTLSFVAGDASKALPTGVNSILAAQDITNDEILTTISTWKQLIEQFSDLDETGPSTHFRVVNETFYMYPKTDRSATIRVYYYVPQAALSAGTDTPNIPLRYHEAIVFGAVAEAHRDDQNQEQAKSYEAKFMELVAMAVSEFTQNPQGESVPLPRASRERWGYNF